jgi:hypothetical protein
MDATSEQFEALRQQRYAALTREIHIAAQLPNAAFHSPFNPMQWRSGSRVPVCREEASARVARHHDHLARFRSLAQPYGQRPRAVSSNATRTTDSRSDSPSRFPSRTPTRTELDEDGAAVGLLSLSPLNSPSQSLNSPALLGLNSPSLACVDLLRTPDLTDMYNKCATPPPPIDGLPGAWMRENRLSDVKTSSRSTPCPSPTPPSSSLVGIPEGGALGGRASLPVENESSLWESPQSRSVEGSLLHRTPPPIAGEKRSDCAGSLPRRPSLSCMDMLAQGR